MKVPVGAASPRIVTDGELRAQVLRSDGKPLGSCQQGPFGTRLCPGVAPGEVISLFATGLGAVTNPPEDGYPA